MFFTGENKSKRKDKKDRETTMGLQRIVLVTVARHARTDNHRMENKQTPSPTT